MSVGAIGSNPVSTGASGGEDNVNRLKAELAQAKSKLASEEDPSKKAKIEDQIKNLEKRIASAEAAQDSRKDEPKKEEESKRPGIVV